MADKKRKHWSEYDSDLTSYGNHKYGFGVYLITGADYWIDPECVTEDELTRYATYCKNRRFHDPDIALAKKYVKANKLTKGIIKKSSKKQRP